MNYARPRGGEWRCGLATVPIMPSQRQGGAGAIEEIDEPLMRRIRRLDRLIDELAKGWPMVKILRTAGRRLA